MLSIDDFFEFETNENGEKIPVQKPINRLSYTDSDIAYKIKYIQAMQDLGMEVSIDKIGNICGTLPGKLFPDKSVICGSHTDSVDNGGQFDGPLGVYAAIKTAEKIVESKKQNLVNYKAVIYASEESTHFGGKACIGSKYLRGDFDDFDSIIAREGRSLSEIVKEYKAKLYLEVYKAGLKELKEVDKVIEPDKIITALEGHIEQSDRLREHENNIGICTSISSPYRLEVDINDIETAADFICDLTESAKQEENLSKFRVTVPEFSIKNDYTEQDLEGKQIVTYRSTGENNHSGGTPMDRRKDAVYAAAMFIRDLKDNPDIVFLETSTPKWGANQITEACDIKFAVSQDISPENLLKCWLSETDSGKKANTFFVRQNDITEQDDSSGLYVDIRQQLGMNPELSNEMVYEIMKNIVHVTHKNVGMHIVSKGKPYLTNQDLVQSASQICKTKEIPHEILESWPGHDLATLTNNKNARTLLLFCASAGGSHNPQETTTVENIEKLVEVESSLAESELDRANELYLKAFKKTLENQRNDLLQKLNFVDKKLEQVQQLSDDFGISFEKEDLEK